LAQYYKLKNKKIDLVKVRGTWPPQNMGLVRALYEYGFMKNKEVEVNGSKFGIMESIAQYLINSDEGKNTKLYGYTLHVEVDGIKDGKERNHMWDYQLAVS